MDERDERGFGCYMDGDWLVDVLLPGFIEAHSARQFGSPCIAQSRVPAYIGLGWVWECVERPQMLDAERFSREQAIALAAFQAGVDWQRSRKRRKRIGEAVHVGWEKHRRSSRTGKGT